MSSLSLSLSLSLVAISAGLIHQFCGVENPTWNDAVAIMVDEMPSSTTMTMTMSTTQSCVKKVKKEDTSNNAYNNSDNKSSIFDDDWKVGNWAWERDYNKYPVVKSNININNNK
jgi:hypothetical protein